MICSKCGAESDNSYKFCTNCGNPLSQIVENHPESQTDKESKEGKQDLIGFSNRINDPAFASYQRKGIAWIFIFSGILSIIVIVSFFIYGETSYEMDNPQALYLGLGIAGMFMTIAILATLSRLTTKQWDGVVIDKKVEKKTRRNKDSNGNYLLERYTKYTVVFKTDQGKIIEESQEDNKTIYNYFQIGDRVRHHKGLGTLEKYDKSKDTIIFCGACSTMNDINDDKCKRCSCPLLK